MSSPAAPLREIREDRKIQAIDRTAGPRKIDTGRGSGDSGNSDGTKVGGDPHPGETQPLPLHGPLGSLLPEGIRPGSTVTVTGSTALALALTAELATSGRWVAGLGWNHMGLLAAHELGVLWDQLVLVGTPADPRQRAAALAAAVEAFDVVVAGPGGHSHTPATGNTLIRPVDARRVRARVRERGAVLVVVDHRAVPLDSASVRGYRGTSHSNGAGPAGTTGRWWPEPAEVELRVTDGSWQGLGQGHGHLRARRVTVEATGRGRLARARQLTLWLPATDGHVRLADPSGAPAATPSGTEFSPRAPGATTAEHGPAPVDPHTPAPQEPGADPLPDHHRSGRVPSSRAPEGVTPATRDTPVHLPSPQEPEAGPVAS